MAVVITVCLKMRDNYAVMRSSEAIMISHGIWGCKLWFHMIWIGCRVSLQLSSYRGCHDRTVRVLKGPQAVSDTQPSACWYTTLPSQMWLEVRYRQPAKGWSRLRWAVFG